MVSPAILPGHPAQILLARREEAEGWPTEVEAVAERLALADGHVHAALAGCNEDTERDRVDLGNDDRRLTRAVAPCPVAPGGP